MKYDITDLAGKVVGHINISDEMATEIAEVAGETRCGMTLHPIVETVPNALDHALAGKSVWLLRGFKLAWQESSKP